MKNVEERRALIKPIKNPRAGSDYIVQLRHNLAPRGLDAVRGIELKLFYVPESMILSDEDYDGYLSYFETKAEGYNSFETLGSDIIDDLNNELVPRWIHLSINAEHAHTIHQINYEERQPNWDNPFLLSRLRNM